MLRCHSLCCFYLSFFFVTLVFTEPFTRGKFHHNRETASQTQCLTITSLLVSTVSLLSWLPLVTANYIFYVKNITTPIKKTFELLYHKYSQLFKLLCKLSCLLIKNT